MSALADVAPRLACAARNLSEHVECACDYEVQAAAVELPKGRTVLLDDEAYARVWWFLWAQAWRRIGTAHTQAARNVRQRQAWVEYVERERAALVLARIARKAARATANRIAVAKHRERHAIAARFAGCQSDYPLRGLSPSRLEEQPDPLFDDEDFWRVDGPRYPFGSRNATGRPSGSAGHQAPVNVTAKVT